MSRARPLLFLALVASLLLAGCTSAENLPRGTLRVYVTDQPNAIDDFASLNVSVERVVLTRADGANTTFITLATRLDLTKATDGRVVEVLRQPVLAGNYSRVDLVVADAQGELKGGGNATVKAPSGRLFVNVPFEVDANGEAHFVFDVQVIRKGNGEYQFQPNASGSGPRAEAPADATVAGP